MENQQQRPKAYSYLRFSTPEQMRGDSNRRQSHLAQEYAERHGLELDEHSFEDFGISAYQGRNQETGSLRLFMRAVEDGAIPSGSYLLVESLDRISRQSARKASSLLGDICDMGITVVTLFDGKAYDANSLDSDPVAFIMAILIFQRAHEESATKAYRLRSVWQEKRKKIASGEPVRLTSRGPQWLRPAGDGVSFEIIPERGEVVRRIYKMALDGVGKKSISETLNTEGVQVFGRGQYWHTSYINKILNNPATYGTLTPFTSRPERKTDREACDPIEGYYPAVIDKETYEDFQALQSSKAPRRGRHSKSQVENVLGGLSVCPLCASTMARVTKNKAKGWVYLVCQRAKQGAGCKYNAVRYDRVEPMIYSKINRLIDACPSGDDSLDAQIEDAKLELKLKEKSIDRMLEVIEQGEMPPNAKGIPFLQDRLAKRRSELDELKASIADLYQQRSMLGTELARHRAESLRTVVLNTPEDKTLINTKMRECFSRVVVDFESTKLVFHWKQGGWTSLRYKASK
ncbi:recombinase family protein [Halomonas sp. TBZ9]|uniref:Recombinase family protein n=1 Tax=Vreelandella azerica TaxID=2732867 RepID=A0A7Y3TZ04_9GAMM|nr:recombinase family protein [Halomonas azerica]NOG32598.1 recombinase family protein [Halomonas azerica]